MTTTNGGSPPVADALDEIAGILEREGISGDHLGDVRLTELDSLLITEILAVLEDHVGHRIVEEAFPPDETTLSDLLTFAEQSRPPT